MKEQPELLKRPYCDRQMIVVLDDRVVDAARKAEFEALQTDRTVNWVKIGEAAAKMLMGGMGLLLAEVTREAVKAWSRARASGVQVLQIKKSEASDLSFPPGHPREGVLYIGHPAMPTVYYTTAAFHRVTFEHKFAEAIDLLMHLGASKITVEHIHGWSREFSARLSVPLAHAASSAKAEAASKRRTGAKLLYEATLSPTGEPKLPENLVWYPHEHTWQSVAKGRLQFGLREFSLTVSYEDDFGVNAGLKANVQKAGLELGGQFENHESTIWRISGQFMPRGNSL
jgi:hypothetical protein